MDSNQITIGIMVGLISVLIIANIAERQTFYRPFVVALLLAICVVFAIYYGILPTGRNALGQLRPAELFTARIVAFAFAASAAACTFSPIRYGLRGLFPRLQPEPTQQEIAFGLGGQVVSKTGLVVIRGFDSASMTHTTALVYCILLFGRTIMEFLLAGGLPGLAAASEGSTITPTELLTQMALFSLVGALGVGIGFRRDLGTMIRRLGLQIPTVNEIIAGVGMAAMCYGLAIAILVISQWFAAPDVGNDNGGTGFYTDGLTTMIIAFLISLSAAVGEEISFRGALQPVFGLYPTSVLFALVHIQYTLTPASFIIVICGLGFGWLRLRFNTTTAIIAHFFYNFGQLFLLVYLRYLYQVIDFSELVSTIRF